MHVFQNPRDLYCNTSVKACCRLYAPSSSDKDTSVTIGSAGFLGEAHSLPGNLHHRKKLFTLWASHEVGSLISCSVNGSEQHPTVGYAACKHQDSPSKCVPLFSWKIQLVFLFGWDPSKYSRPLAFHKPH